MNPINVYAIVEGQTELYFLRDVLNPYLLGKGLCLTPKVIGKLGQQGGFVTFDRAKGDINRYLRQRGIDFITTFFDFYGINNNFPGYIEVQDILETGRRISATEKANIMENRFMQELKNYCQPDLEQRVITYIQVYEFEALLFSDAEILSETIRTSNPKPVLKPNEIPGILSRFSNPEEINDSPQTAPSKRLYGINKRDDKTLKVSKAIFGRDVTRAIGIDKIRGKCPHFNEWLCKLENLPALL